MYLAELKLVNFRSCLDTVVEFTGDLTVLVGENGSGKSNVIDAIRLSTLSTSERPSIWFDQDRDRTYNLPAESIVKISNTYHGLTDMEKAVFMPQLVDGHGNLVYNLTFKTSGMHSRSSRAHFTVGENELPDAEPESRELVAHVYLPPLRDAVRELGSSDGIRLAEILRVLSDNNTEQFESDANDIVKRVAELSLSLKVKEATQNEFQKLTHPARGHEIHVGSRTQELRRLAGLLRVTLSENGIQQSELGASGLGLANLLFISMVVLQLEKARKYDLTLLLVEEPEAHLHPQLQSVLLAYLRDRARESQKSTRTTHEPSGRIQVIVSTHSPNLASSVSTQNIVAVSRQHSNNTDIWWTKTRALSRAGLNDVEQRKIDRYLNVTRASLVFARQVFLVEGISDSITLLSLAKHVVLNTDKNAVQQIESTSIIAIDGVDFKPYLKLLLGGEFCLVDKVVVITDGDKNGNSVPGQDRKTEYENLYVEAVDAGILNVFVGEYTLEADLFGLESNDSLLRAAYLEIHPRSATKWQEVIDATGGNSEFRARCFRDAMRNDQLDISKGDFSQLVASALEAQPNGIFEVPRYLDQAIKAVLIER